MSNHLKKNLNKTQKIPNQCVFPSFLRRFLRLPNSSEIDPNFFKYAHDRSLQVSTIIYKNAKFKIIPKYRPKTVRIINP